MVMGTDGMKANVLFYVMISLLVGLYGPIASADAPEWALKPPNDSASFYYGVGSSSNKDQAAKAALAEIAGRWSVSISAEDVSQFELKDGQTRESYVSNIKSQVKSTEFSHFKVLKTEKIDYVYWVLVEVDRAKMIGDLKFKIGRSKKEINRDFANLASVSDLERAKYAAELKPKLLSLRSIAATLRAVDPGYDATADLDDVSNKIANLKKVQSQIVVSIQNDTNTKVFAKDLASKLTQQKVKIVSGSGQSNTVISISGDVEYNFLMDVHWAKMAVDIQAKDKSGKILATNIHRVTGASPTSKQAALQQANRKLTKKLEQEGLLESIGL